MFDFREFIVRTNGADSVEALYRHLEEALAEIGYDRFVYSFLTDHPAIGKTAGHGELRNYPDDWFRYYLEQGYGQADPAIRFGRLYHGPIPWSQLERNHQLSRLETKIFREGEEAGLLDGIAVPLHGPNGELAGFGIASSTGGVELDRNLLSMIAAIAQQFHLVYCDLFRNRAMPLPAPVLTAREREVLRWCMEGKSNWETGQLLSISEHGVEFHLRNIYRKLQVNSRICAVVKAIRLGLIELA